jgi:hypothetical protein
MHVEYVMKKMTALNKSAHLATWCDIMVSATHLLDLSIWMLFRTGINMFPPYGTTSMRLPIRAAVCTLGPFNGPSSTQQKYRKNETAVA